MTLRRRSLLIFLAALAVDAVERPAECPLASWHAECYFALTCQTLFEGNIDCTAAMGMGTCGTVCGEGCCFTTTSTTTTLTATSHTITETTVTMTMSTTITTTSTKTHSATSTSTGTSTRTSSMTDTSYTVTTTATNTVSTTTTSATTTTPPTVVVRVKLDVEVNDPAMLAVHIHDARVSAAYASAFAEESGISKSFIHAELEPSGSNNMSLVLVITFPAMKEGEVLLTNPPIAEVQKMINSVEVAAFSDLASEKIDEELGPGTFVQKILAPVVDSVDAVAMALSRNRVTWAALLMILMSCRLA